MLEGRHKDVCGVLGKWRQQVVKGAVFEPDSVHAAQMGLGDTSGGEDMGKVFAALNVMFDTASVITGGKHGEPAASSRGARSQSMDVDVERDVLRADLLAFLRQ